MKKYICNLCQDDPCTCKKTFEILGDFGFFIEAVQTMRTIVRFTVWEIRSYEDSELTKIHDKEFYLECDIKWDACANMTLGVNPAETPIFHLCGARDFKKHCALLKWMYSKAFELMGREPDEVDKWE